MFGEWRKYLMVSLFLVLTIGFVSGMYVANGSMMQAAKDGEKNYHLEDGHFELGQRADDELIKAIEQAAKEPITIYENFFRNERENEEGTVRVFPKTEYINQACLMEGTLPKEGGEIAIDRMHADNAKISVGDQIKVGGEMFTVTGLIAYVNYSTLHEKSTDLIFDALKFNVAMVTKEGFDRLSGQIHYRYAWQYKQPPKDVVEEKKWSDELLEKILPEVMKTGNELVDYLPGYADPAVNFATEDMGSDMAMGGVLLYILIGIIAFVFAVTTSNTIVKEAGAIGTLRAMGYTKGELIRHYLTMPVWVTLLSAAIGNGLGYTVFTGVVTNMYYNSYSLPAYRTIWNAEAFLKTTFVPVLLMFVINLAVLIKRMQLSPLAFLRHDFNKKKRNKAMRLPPISFFGRFRLRIILQNIPSYAVLLTGILFVAILLAMAVGMPSTLKHYQDHAADMMFAKYQYVLAADEDPMGNPITTSTEGAEAYAMKSLLLKGKNLEEEISVYGIAKNSQYVRAEGLWELTGTEVYLSSSYADKYGIKMGDTLTLNEKYEEDAYTFTVRGIVEDSPSLAVFLSLDEYRRVFGEKEGAFTGFFSNQAITDIPGDGISATITQRDITKMADQLDHSMGSYMTYFQYLCILLSAVLMYLLTKLIIEKNETAISMIKILGYRESEIVQLYILSTFMIVLLGAGICAYFGVQAMNFIWRMMMMSYTGWFSFQVQPLDYVKIVGFILAGYVIVVLFDFRRIRHIKMDEALKNRE